MPCFITRTGSFLPGPPVENDAIERYLGTLADEAEVKEKVLAMNGIVRRHYAQDERQQATHDVYELAAEAVTRCLQEAPPGQPISFLVSGTTYAPFSGPGFSSLLHRRLKERGLIEHPLEISSHGGICTSSAAALVNAIRSVERGDHAAALSVGAEHASEILKSSVIRPIDDRAEHADLRQSQWFMSVFLRFMLSDGAGAVLLEDRPRRDGLSLKVNWTHARSFAHEAPLCMKLENTDARLTQDVTILGSYLVPMARKFVADAMETHGDTLASYQGVLPHMSSFFFRRKMERVMQDHAGGRDACVPYWTNLATAGNTGAASIYVMLDEYLRQHDVRHGDRLLLFVPESGQFNFVMVSLTAVIA